MVLNVTSRAPLLPWEVSGRGELNDQGRAKDAQTVWECHHNGDAFDGEVQPFGRLVYLLPGAHQTSRGTHHLARIVPWLAVGIGHEVPWGLPNWAL